MNKVIATIKETQATNSKTSERCFAIISDVHLGNKRNKAADIIENLDAAFPDNAETAKLSLVVIAGDLFDSLLSSLDVVIIVVWFARFLRICKKHDISVRVLEGTPSHDWKQSEIMAHVNSEVANIGADLIYVKNLSIRYEEKFDMNFLFVPDEWTNSTDKTLSQVKDLLRTKGLDQVDYAFMHGQFDFQLPPHVKAQKHDSTEYLKIVKELVFIGHDHRFKMFDRIFVQGSFDRISHNEEEPKGHIRVNIQPDNTKEVIFVENTGSKKFLTVKCYQMSMDQTLTFVDKFVEKVPDGSHIRIEAEPSHPAFSNMDTFVLRHPFLVWEKHPKATDKDKPEVYQEDVEYIPITITSENVKTLLLERLNLKMYSVDVVSHSQTILNEVLQ